MLSILVCLGFAVGGLVLDMVTGTKSNLLVVVFLFGIGIKETTSVPYWAFDNSEWWQRNIYGSSGYALIGVLASAFVIQLPLVWFGNLTETALSGDLVLLAIVVAGLFVAIYKTGVHSRQEFFRAAADVGKTNSQVFSLRIQGEHKEAQEVIRL